MESIIPFLISYEAVMLSSTSEYLIFLGAPVRVPRLSRRNNISPCLLLALGGDENRIISIDKKHPNQRLSSLCQVEYHYSPTVQTDHLCVRDPTISSVRAMRMTGATERDGRRRLPY